jgi:hypothetical protein
MSNAKLKSLGVRKADNNVYPRLILDLCGRPKQGKTHFALTAPGKILILNTDIGLEGVVHKFTAQKHIEILDFRVPYNMTEACTERDRVKNVWKIGMESGEIRTVIVDTATDLWDLFKIAEFGKLTPGGADVQFKWGSVNREYQALLRTAYDTKTVNLILIHQTKKKYIKMPEDNQSHWNGEYERAGFSKMEYIVQINAEVYRDHDKVFHIKIDDCRQNPDMAGEDYPSMDIEDITLRKMISEQQVTFSFLAQMALPETSSEDWE